MAEFRTRIRAVRFKSGGEVRVLPSVREDTSRQLEAEIHAVVSEIWSPDWHQGRVAGFAVVAWTANGDVATRVNNSDTSPFPVSVIPSMLADSIRRVITIVQINDALGFEDEAS